MTRRFSIRLLVPVAVAVPVVVLAAALVWLSVSSSRSIAERLAGEIVEQTSNHLRLQIRDYFSTATRISDLYVRRMDAGLLPTASGLQAWERAMLDDIVAHPRIASICFGNPAGDATWLLRHGPRMEVGQAIGARQGEATEHEIWADGGRKKEPIRTYQYDPRLRPWYKVALENSGPVWTPVYFWFGMEGDASEVGPGYTRRVFNKDGTLAGVLVIDTTLGAINDFVKNLPVCRDRHGMVFILDEKDLLVVASEGEVTVRKQRVGLDKAGTPAATAVGAFLQRGQSTGRIVIDGQTARVNTLPLVHMDGLRWRAVVVVPESSFLAEVHQAQFRAVILAALAVLGALVLALFLAGKMTRPLLALLDHVRRIGHGDFGQHTRVGGARELGALSDALNRMAGELKQRMQLQHSLALATQVQESLMPSSWPISPRLDIYGTSRCRDGAAGEYFDRIDIGDLPDHRALVAVGDVIGQGIGASLMMSSARAALQATASRPGALGDLLTAINGVLRRESAVGKGMSLLLVLLEPEQGQIRWASAGQDAPMLYEPRAEDFIDLVGTGPALGTGEARYIEHAFRCLNPYQVLLLGTNGIWEARDGRGEMFGKQRLKQIVRQNIEGTAAQIARAIDMALAGHLRGTRAESDITFVVVKVLPVGEGTVRRVSGRA